MKKKDEIKVCLVGSSGGHLTHLYMLKPFWKDKNRFWVTFDKEDARSLLEGEKVYPCYFPTNRSIKALIKNTKIAWDVLHKEKPDLIISCGAAVAVPFFYIGKMMGAKLVYAPCILYDLDGYYTGLRMLLGHMIETGLSSEERQEGIYFAKDLAEIKTILSR